MTERWRGLWGMQFWHSLAPPLRTRMIHNVRYERDWRLSRGSKHCANNSSANAAWISTCVWGSTRAWYLSARLGQTGEWNTQPWATRSIWQREWNRPRSPAAYRSRNKL